VAKRYVHTLPKGQLLATHQQLLAAGLPSPFGEEPLTAIDEVPMGTPDEEVTTVVDVAAWLEHKRAAMAAHRSQIGPDSFFLNTPPELVERAFATEAFVLEAGTPGVTTGVEDDLFAGLPG
jgi:LmbE family N-acetylglucosaminyl deacetylase